MAMRIFSYLTGESIFALAVSFVLTTLLAVVVLPVRVHWFVSPAVPPPLVVVVYSTDIAGLLGHRQGVNDTHEFIEIKLFIVEVPYNLFFHCRLIHPKYVMALVLF